MAAVVHRVVDVVVRAVDDLQRRQEGAPEQPPSTTASQLVSSAIESISTSTIAVASSTLPAGPNTAVPTITPTQSPNGNNGNGSTSSPLLFFVALGFGVVFTNLWIIVGVKYCFRYNSRNRQLRLTEDGEPIGMENMHPRPRRRREKKLMTMDEVNEKFPMMKYKNWVAQRAKEGLPTAGGVSAPPSRAGSIRSVHAVIASKERESTEAGPTIVTLGEPADKKPAAETSGKDVTDPAVKSTAQIGEGSSDAQAKPSGSGPATAVSPTPAAAAASTTTTTPDGETPPAAGSSTHRHSSEDEEDDDEHINAALPPELLGSSGDTCAICIDTLENDDDVRGLTCGHAFHASCLDPWLTSRRACCPLCKADYYTPKPRPTVAEGAAGGAAVDPNNPLASPRGGTAGDSSRMNMASRPVATWYGIRGHRMILSGRLGGQSVIYSTPATADYHERRRERRRQPTAAVPADADANANAGGRRFNIPFFGRRNNNNQAAAADGAPAAASSMAPNPPQRRASSVAAPASSPVNTSSILDSIRVPGLGRRGNRSQQQSAQPSGSGGDVPMASGANVTPSQLEAGVRSN